MREPIFRAQCWCYNHDLDEIRPMWLMGQPNLIALTNEGPKYEFVTHAHGRLIGLGVGETYIYKPQRFGFDLDTLSQFTGVLDKDGRKIFEGDIIRFNAGYALGRWTGVVEYDEKNGQFVARGERDRFSSNDPGTFKVGLSEIDKPTIEIIGNIHDNPELLKGE